jgi:uncharacterized protein (TIGR03083 family)
MLGGMDPDDLLAASRAAVAAGAGRLADLVAVLPDVDRPIPGSRWTARDALAHLIIACDLYTEMATGTPSPVDAYGREVFADYFQQRLAYVPEDDPTKLAHLLEDAADRFTAALAGQAGATPVVWHAGYELDIASLAGIIAGEVLIHGYDIALACRRPWPLPVDEVAPVLLAYAPLLRLNVDVERTRGLTVSYAIDVRGVASFTVRFTGGQLSLEPAGSAPADCTISADPVAWLLVASGRLDRWAAIALGLLQPGGDRPGLAVDFQDLFVYP